MPERAFDDCVFINCPLDEEFAPILKGMLFCVIYLGLRPRLATERIDGAEDRLAKILDLIGSSRYSIHDLSRCRASEAGEMFRLNMPFELGLDYAYRHFLTDARRGKALLILEETKYLNKAALSDLSGCDFEAHDGDFQTAIRKVRNWLVDRAGVAPVGAAKIGRAYSDFQEWWFERQLAAGFSEEDILDYPTSELLAAMQEWVALGEPI